MIMWQEVTVYLIGTVIVAYVAIAVYRFVTRRGNPCSGCAGCNAKNELDIKRRTCGGKPEAPRNTGRV